MTATGMLRDITVENAWVFTWTSIIQSSITLTASMNRLATAPAFAWTCETLACSIIALGRGRPAEALSPASAGGCIIDVINRTCWALRSMHLVDQAIWKAAVPIGTAMKRWI